MKGLAELGPEATREFVAELDQQALAGTRVCCGLGVVAFLSFALIDPLLVEETGDLLAVRALVVLATLAVLALSYLPSAARRPVLLAVAAGWVIGGGVIAVTLMTGGGESRYHEALLLTYMGLSLIIPWRPSTAALACGGLSLAYGLVMWAADATGPMGTWITNNGILWVAVAIAVTATIWSRRLRTTEFVGRYQLARAHEDLQELDRAKSRFFANISHELRTPLTLTLAPIETLLERGGDPLSEGQRENLELAQRNALRLLRELDDLLELSRVENSSLRLRLEPIDVPGLLGDLIEEVRPLAARKGIEVSLHPAPEELPVILADRSWVEKIVLNVVSNAIKFSEVDRPIELTLLRSQDHLALEVADRGIGIPPDQLEQVFQRFHQVDPSGTRRQGGTGIGLALAQEVARLHGGRITAHNRPGGGSVFRIELPEHPPSDTPIERRQQRKGASQERRSADEGLLEWQQALRHRQDYRLLDLQDATERRLVKRNAGPGERRSVLVVDDSPDLIRYIAALLRPEFEVMTALDGRSALHLAERLQPDLILTDLMMPEMDGLELLQHLRTGRSTARIPVVMLTARNAAEDRGLAREGGADAYLAKPFHARELLATVQRLLEVASAQEERAARSEDESLELLAAGIAHEILNPLGFLRSALFILHQQAAAGEDVDVAYEAGQEGIERIMNAVEELRLVSGVADQAGPGPVDPRQVVDRVAVLVRPRPGLEVHTETRGQRWVRLPPGHLDRVLLHLVINAAQAMGEEGRVELRCWDEGDAEVVLSVSDTGPGVPEAQREGVFKPYYSTRGAEGSGLGLALARRIVRAAGGSIRIEEAEGGGALLILRLPASEP